MATQQRRKRASLKEDLFDQPQMYEFHQAVRLLETIFQDTYREAGDGISAKEEVVQLKSRVGLSTPSSDIYSLQDVPKTPPEMEVNFFGVAGIQGPLPQSYTEYIVDRLRDRDTTLKAFLDIFNHRMMGVLHRLRKKQSPALNVMSPEHTPFGRTLKSLIGLKEKDVEETYGLNPQSLLPFAALFWRRPHSAVGLKVLLEYFFKVPVKIHLFQGGWMNLDDSQRTHLGRDQGFSRLGQGACLGVKAWDSKRSILISMGPMPKDLFQRCLKEGPLYKTLMRLIHVYLPAQVGFKVQLNLDKTDCDQSYLHRKTRLGENSWLLSKPYEAKDAGVDDQVVLIPEESDFLAHE